MDLETEVVVVGGGACGLMATAIAATSMGGAEVVLLEKDSRLGCNAEIASGTLIAAGTRFQRAAGIQDSPELMAEDILRKAGGKSDPDVTLALCRKSAEMVHWWVDELGVPIELGMEMTRVGHTRLRMHAHPTRSGAPLVQALRGRVRSLSNVMYADRMPALGLITDRDGRVIGARAGRDGRAEQIGCRKVVLATGGFGANREMLARFIPEATGRLHIGVESNTGDGIRWGMEVGAAVEHMRGYQGHGYVVSGYGTRLNPGVIYAGGIVVNRLGERFEREDQGYSEWAGVVLRQPGGVGIAVWDERIQELYGGAHTMVESQKAGAIHRAESIEELAERFGLDPSKLAATMSEYNAGVARKRDALGRVLLDQPLAPPFYAAMITGAIAHTLGGLKIDIHGRVLRPDGRPVPNLYAGGGTAVGLSGDRPDGYLSGSGLLTAYGLGMIIGQHVARSLNGEC